MRTMLGTYFMLVAVTLAFADGGIPVTYKVNDKPYEGYYVDAGKNTPFILLIHDWNGIDDYEIERCRMLLKLGFTVFAADLFGAGTRPSTLKDQQKQTNTLYNDREKMRSVMRGALLEAERRGANVKNAVAMGYCFGGAAVLELARSGEDLKGFVAFHGGLTVPEGQDFSKTRGKILILHGAADKFVSMDQFSALAKIFESAGIDHEMIVYGGADHAFTVFGGDRYNESADKKSWRRFAGFLEETLKK